MTRLSITLCSQVRKDLGEVMMNWNWTERFERLHHVLSFVHPKMSFFFTPLQVEKQRPSNNGVVVVVFCFFFCSPSIFPFSLLFFVVVVVVVVVVFLFGFLFISTLRVAVKPTTSHLAQDGSAPLRHVFFNSISSTSGRNFDQQTKKAKKNVTTIKSRPVLFWIL